MNNEKISIIVPIYNSEKTLIRCVESLLNQTYTDIEVILVDDGSKDHSLEICRSYKNKDSRIQVIHKKNGGVSSARNIGLDAANGTYVMFCDSDDWVEDDWCETMLKSYVPGALVMCGYYCHHKDYVQCVGEEVKSNRILKENFLLTKPIAGFAPWNKLYYRAEIVKNNIRFPENISLGEDQLFVWRYLCQMNNDIVYCKKPLNHYVWPEGEGQSLTLNLPINYYEQCKVIFSEIAFDIQNGCKCSQEAQTVFYRDSYFQYERAIRRIFQDSEINFLKKIKLAHNVMHSDEYKFVVRCDGIFANPIIQLLCKRGSSVGMYIVYKMGK